MRRRISGWSYPALAGLLFMGAEGPAGAVEPNEGGEVILNSEFMVMDSFGTDLNVFELKIEDDPTSSGSAIATTEGTDINHDKDFGWRGDLQYKDRGWGAGISGFHFDNDGSEEAFVAGDTLAAMGRSEVSLRTAGSSFDCLERGDFEGDCSSSVDSEIKVWMVDLYGIRELVSTPDVGIDLQFGLRIADYEWEMDSFAALLDPMAPGGIGDEEPVAASSSSDTDDPLAGPFVSILSTGRYGRFRVDGQITQAVVFGELDQGTTRLQYERNTGIGPLVLEDITTLHQNHDAVIPITDIRIKLGYDIIDNLTLGFGAYATTWFNVPEPPNMEAIDRSLGVSSLQSDEENLTFLGASFSLEYRFRGGRLPDLSSLMP